MGVVCVTQRKDVGEDELAVAAPGEREFFKCQGRVAFV